jgi:hypothetical protein
VNTAVQPLTSLGRSSTGAKSRMAGLLVAAGMLVGQPVVAGAQLLELEGRYWPAAVEARAKIEGGALPGTALDFERDLGIDEEPLADLRLAALTGPNSRLRLAYTHAAYEGDRVVDRDIEFNGTTYLAATRVVSELDLHYARLGWIWQLPLSAGRLRVGPLVEVKGFLVETTLDAPTATPRRRETESVRLVIPTVGLALDLSPLPGVAVFTEASGLSVGQTGHVVDAEAGVRVTLMKLFTLIGGYRVFDVRGEEDASFARLRLSGPFAGATIRF